MSVVACWVCGVVLPIELAQEHHRNPQSVGAFADNSDENLIHLDAGCHHNLHRLGERIFHGEPDRARDLAEQVYSGGAVARILELAQHDAAERIALKEGERDPTALVDLTLSGVAREITVLLDEAASREGLSRNRWMMRMLLAALRVSDGEQATARKADPASRRKIL